MSKKKENDLKKKLKYSASESKRFNKIVYRGELNEINEELLYSFLSKKKS